MRAGGFVHVAPFQRCACTIAGRRGADKVVGPGFTCLAGKQTRGQDRGKTISDTCR
jgi:hypothetical protein